MNKSSRKRSASEKKEPMTYAQLLEVRKRKLLELQDQIEAERVVESQLQELRDQREAERVVESQLQHFRQRLSNQMQPPPSPAPPPPQPNNIILNLSDADDYVPPHFGETRQTAIEDFKANKYPAPYLPPGRPDSPTYLSEIEMDPEVKKAHKEYDREVRKRPLSPQGKIVTSSRSTNKAYNQSKKIRAKLESDRTPEIFYESPQHRRRIILADGKTKRKKPKTKRKKHTKKRKIKKRKSTRKK